MSGCELCTPKDIVRENALAYSCHEKNSLSRGHMIIVPKRHVADFFAMTAAERAAVMDLLQEARDLVQKQHSPDGYNIGANVGAAAGQSRMHVHFHLIPRYKGDVPDPSGGIRRALKP